MHILRESSLLLLFVVSGLGYLLGRVRVLGLELGVAAVLFVGLAASAIDPALKLPELVPSFGLGVFVYTLGLGSGPGFFGSLRRRGLRDASLAIGAITLGAACAAIAGVALGLGRARTSGLFAGSLTNTPALAQIVQALKDAHASPEQASAPVVAYSVAYPFGVIGALVVLAIAQRVLRRRTSGPDTMRPARGALVVRAVELTQGGDPEVLGAENKVVLARYVRAGQVATAMAGTHLEPGDIVTVVGTENDVARALTALGKPSDAHPELDRTVLDFRRVFVSNPQAIGRPLHELGLPARFSAVITRIRRGDIEMLATKDTVLELGDRVRVVAPRQRMTDVAKFLGDSYRALAEIDVISFSLGIALGLLVGMIPIPFPGTTIKLGAAGGPLVVGLVLGRLGRSGPLVWSLPFSANLTLRQLGLLLFLAGVGTRSGDAFAATLQAGGALPMLAAGAMVTVVVATAILFVGYRLLRIPLPTLTGMLAGIHTQPAVLAFAAKRSGEEATGAGYAAVFPVATLAKIVAGQLLVTLLR
ncbi:MAG: aspartate:alanine exchanger family transporter [Polyangiaceae bacterium]